MFDLYKKIRDILNPRERKNAVLLFAMILTTGIMEAIGVASIMPFLSVLSDPAVIHQNAYLSYFYQELNFSDTQSFLFFVGGIVFLIIVTSLSFRGLTEYAIVRFSQMRNYTLSTKLLQSYLARPYSWFLNRHSADLGKTILSEVEQVISQTLLPTARCIANAVIAICLIVLLLLVNPWVALFAAGFLGGAYALIFYTLRKYLSYIGQDRLKANQERFQIAQESLGGIKEVKAANLEAGYIRSFSKPALRLARRNAANVIVGKLPHFVMQAITLGSIIAITLILLAVSGGELSQVLPTVGVFALAGQRLSPALNQVYSNATKMRFGKPALDALHADLMEKTQDSKSLKFMKQALKCPPLGLNNCFELVDVSFWYPKADRPALQNLSLNIKANTTVGFVGSTGAGKTTAVDIILGLLSPTQGSLQVDQVPITEQNRSAWQRTLGYVPQQNFLADDTVTANIAFGISKTKIDQEAVEKAARIAELHDFVLNELPKGYDTLVGERGVRLSGGQRQRIGIARALYHDPDVLILDEATSALDNLTEMAIMQAVHNLSKKKTIILIAHRLSTVRKCNQIFLLEHGRLAGRGTYDELVESSEEFRKMTVVNE